MSIRTSGYYKESRNLGELVYNSDFEFGIKGWKYEGWQYVILPDFAVQEDVNSIYPEEAIEIFPEDLLMLCVTVRETTYSHTFRMRLKYYDKHDKVITYEEVSKKPLADTTTTYNLLFAPSTLFFNEYTSLYRSIRAVRPWIYVLKSDGWTTGDTLSVFNISLRRINPDWLKSLPVELWSCLYITALEKGTYYGDEYYTFQSYLSPCLTAFLIFSTSLHPQFQSYLSPCLTKLITPIPIPRHIHFNPTLVRV